MPFHQGSVSYARFRVVGGPDEPSHDLLESMADHVLRPSSVGEPPEIESGWTAGRHLLDHDFGSDQVLFGDALLFGLRIDVNRVPGELRRAYRVMAEQARAGASPTGRIGAREKREAKEEAEARCREELASGRHRRSKVVPVLWFVRRHLLLAPAFGDAVREELMNCFSASFGGRLESQSAGRYAWNRHAQRGETRLIEDLRPAAFSGPPVQADGGGDQPIVPWATSGNEPHDFLGNELLVWLWQRLEGGEGLIDTPSGRVGVAFERALDVQCAWDAAGKVAMTAGAPTRLPEARTALRTGKWPRKAGMVIAADDDPWTLTFQGDQMIVTGARLPVPQEAPASDREAIEWRIAQIEALDRAIEALFSAFLDLRTSSKWNAERQKLAAWIRGSGGAPAAPSPPSPAPIVEVVHERETAAAPAG
jgi:hypothetical protein